MTKDEEIWDTMLEWKSCKKEKQRGTVNNEELERWGERWRNKKGWREKKRGKPDGKRIEEIETKL